MNRWRRFFSLVIAWHVLPFVAAAQGWLDRHWSVVSTPGAVASVTLAEHRPTHDAITGSDGGFGCMAAGSAIQVRRTA